MNGWGTLAPGQIIDAEEHKKRQQLANKTKERERPVWATGVAQARGVMEAHAALREEADNPFARADIDPRAEAAQRDAVRFGDPMAGTGTYTSTLAFIRIQRLVYEPACMHACII